jgi:hypothetical protein
MVSTEVGKLFTDQSRVGGGLVEIGKECRCKPRSQRKQTRSKPALTLAEMKNCECFG